MTRASRETRMRAKHRRVKATCAFAIVAVASIAVGAATATGAEISPRPGNHPLRQAAAQVARKIAVNHKQVKNAYFSLLPPRGTPVGIGSGLLDGFPLSGKKFAILSTGSALLADDKDTSGSTGRRDGGARVRGARDVTTLRIRLHVPKKANCLSIRFRFLTEEFPEFVGTPYNDFFIAELDHTNWDAGSRQAPTIHAPNDFAFDSKGNVISVNSAGPATVSHKRAKGTTYDGATRILRASTRVTSGLHRLYLSIGDQGDRQYDSAVFLDRLTLHKRAQCKTGVRVAKTA